MNIEALEDFLDEDATIFVNPSFEGAIVGATHDGRVVYSMRLMINSLMNEDNISEEEAIEFIDYNTLRTIPYMGEKAPIILMYEEV